MKKYMMILLTMGTMGCAHKEGGRLGFAQSVEAVRAPASDNAGFLEFKNATSEKNYFQQRFACGVYALHALPNNKDTYGIEEHSVAVDSAFLDFGKEKKVADVGVDYLERSESQEYAKNFPENAFYRPIDRQYVQTATRVYRVTAVNRGDVFRNSCSSHQQAATMSKDQTWTLIVEEGVSLRIELPQNLGGYSYSTVRNWKALLDKKSEVEEAPDNGYRLYKTKVKSLDLYYRCTAYVPNCVD